jgi:hypothetical protein
LLAPAAAVLNCDVSVSHGKYVDLVSAKGKEEEQRNTANPRKLGFGVRF